MSRPTRVAPLAGPEVAALVYELLDAHDDTVRLVERAGLAEDDLAWVAHLDYLRALQRAGREALARLAGEPGP